MDQDISEEQEGTYQSHLKIHLKNDQIDLPPEDQIKLLEKRNRTKWFHLVINVVAILLFGYSFYYDITQLSQTFFIIIAAVFGINVILIFYQKRQITQLIEYLRRKQHE